MKQSRIDQILAKIDQARDLYSSLVLVVGPPESGKTRVLHKVALEISVPLINVNLQLSRQLLELTAIERQLSVGRLLGDMVRAAPHDVVLLDNTEILFDADLKQEPLLLLEQVSRNKTVVASWNGSLSHSYLIYAAPGHPEYRRYPIGQLVTVNLERT